MHGARKLECGGVQMPECGGAWGGRRASGELKCEAAWHMVGRESAPRVMGLRIDTEAKVLLASGSQEGGRARDQVGAGPVDQQAAASRVKHHQLEILLDAGSAEATWPIPDLAEHHAGRAQAAIIPQDVCAVIEHETMQAPGAAGSMGFGIADMFLGLRLWPLAGGVE